MRVEGKLTDFTIICKSRTWPVHQMVMVGHSKVLEKICVGQFRVGYSFRMGTKTRRLMQL